MKNPCFTHALVSSSSSMLLQPHVLELERLAFDAGGWRGNPVCDLARLSDGLHKALDVFAILDGRQPFGAAALELFRGNHVAFGVEEVAGVLADVAVEARRGQRELVFNVLFGDVLVPALKRALAVLDVLAAKHLVRSEERRV